MDISKVQGSGRLAPKPESKEKPKPAKGEFDSALNRAMKSTKAPEAASEEAKLDTKKAKMIHQRIKSGFYNRPDVLSDIADKVIKRGGSK